MVFVSQQPDSGRQMWTSNTRQELWLESTPSPTFRSVSESRRKKLLENIKSCFSRNCEGHSCTALGHSMEEGFSFSHIPIKL